jgi:hypothetical protein
MYMYMYIHPKNYHLLYWVSDCCFTPSEQFFSHIMARTCYIFMRWWWCLFCIRPTCQVFSDSLVLVYHQGRRNRKGGVMVSMIGQSVVECGFESRSDQTKNYKIGICSFSAKIKELPPFDQSPINITLAVAYILRICSIHFLMKCI